MINAEELGIDSSNVDAMRADSQIHARIVGSEGEINPSLGLSQDWAYQVIKQVGNYGEVMKNM